MNAIKLEGRIREAIEGAIDEFEMEYGLRRGNVIILWIFCLNLNP